MFRSTRGQTSYRTSLTHISSIEVATDRPVPSPCGTPAIERRTNELPFRPWAHRPRPPARFGHLLRRGSAETCLRYEATFGCVFDHIRKSPERVTTGVRSQIIAWLVDTVLNPDMGDFDGGPFLSEANYTVTLSMPTTPPIYDDLFKDRH